MEADDDATAAATADPTTTSDGALLGVCGDQLNINFKHQCFEGGVRLLGAKLLTPVEGDIGPRILSIPGIPVEGSSPIKSEVSGLLWSVSSQTVPLWP